MIEHSVSAAGRSLKVPLPRLTPRKPMTHLRRRPWLAVAVVLPAAALLFVAVTGMRPAYDAYGWLVWGHQALHLSLNTDAAPSWKPLSFLFTFPYALLGRAALFLWMETSTVFAFAGPLFAARIAYRLTQPDVPRSYPRIAAALFAAVGVLGIEGYGHFVLIADSDPMIVALCLAAIDAHLSKHPRLAWAALVLAALGRPEVWPMTLGYAVWFWRGVPERRREVIAGGLLVLLLWFAIPALTSPSLTIAGDIAQSSAAPIQGSKLVGVIERFLSLYELPMQLAVVVAVTLGIVRRRVIWLWLAGLSVLWVAVEVAFAYHGWPASARYMFEPAAVLVVVAAAGAGELLGMTPRAKLVRWGGVAVVAAVVLTLVPHARLRARLLHNGIVLGQQWALQIHRLQGVVDRDGGAKRILSCGRVVTEVSFQTILAWEMGENVADVGWETGDEILEKQPMVLFEPHGAGWIVTPVNTPPAEHRQCRSLAIQTPTGV